MTVIVLSACPQKLKGDITRWMFEIDTGAYVGNPSARVRDALWKRICDNIGSGRASMAYSTNNEQGFDVKIIGCQWEPADFDGITLVKRVFEDTSDSDYKKRSKANINHIIGLAQKKNKSSESDDYVAVDIETTGLRDDDSIIEIAAIKVRNSEAIEKYASLVKCEQTIPPGIVKLTGITDRMIESEGIEPEKAIKAFAEFCGNDTLLGHNIAFDMRFIQKLLKKYDLPQMKNKIVDTMRLARKKMDLTEGYGLASVCKSFGIEFMEQHRAIVDCELTCRIYEKLKEI